MFLFHTHIFIDYKCLVDPAGKIWRVDYDTNAVGDMLGTDSQDLTKVAEFLNKNFSKPRTEKAQLSERITLVTTSVVHKRSIWKSLDGTRRHYCYLFLPNKKGFVYQRRYPCCRCDFCKDQKFLQCPDEYCGQWTQPIKITTK